MGATDNFFSFKIICLLFIPNWLDENIYGQKSALEMERNIDQGRIPTRRSKSIVMEALKAQLGNLKLKELTRERLVQFGKDRSKQGTGLVAISMDIGYVKLIVSHAAAVHGIDISPEPVDMSRIAELLLVLFARQHCDISLPAGLPCPETVPA